ncbi:MULTISPECIES: DMT family transporter [unclassified Chelatococcus]|uniref:DMT family transporter n=1 Tax=unclassified Chelatococcus TaxID=2638111 RepID=UPI001BD0088A|nr:MULTISPECIES: DMT family transporter [unclassified Chelatococcus]MBS7700513.1 DMT family transporter [Chelatococcus sp. YT9]MBX3556309.1 DMT family transporter [Chelatococcus sp.]
MITRPAVGITLMLASSLLLTINDALTKLLLGRLPTGQIVLTQALITISVVLAISIHGRGAKLEVQSRPRQLLRALFNVGSLLTFVTGLMYLPLSIAIALSFANPLFVLLLAPATIGEKLDGARLMAVVVGFVGVLVVINPASGTLSLYALLPLASAACAAFRDIVTRRIAQTDATQATMLYSAAATALVGLIWSGGEFVMPAVNDALLLAIMSAAYLGALYCMIDALRYAGASTVSPFKYTSLIWAVALDQLIWMRPPALNVLIGAMIIVMAMIFIYRRERANAAIRSPVR